MFGMGMTELLVILAVALLILGPQRLPDLASGLGKAIRDFRRATRDLTDQIEVDDSIRRPFIELKSALRDEPLPPEMRPAAPHVIAFGAVPPEQATAAAAVAEALPDGSAPVAEDCLAGPTAEVEGVVPTAPPVRA